MTRQKLLLGMALTMALGASAAPLTPDEALARLSESSSMKRLPSATFANLKLAQIVPAVNGEAALYVFNNENSKGYCILSAEDSTIPMVGYSDSGTFDVNDIPPALEYWLGEYSRQISYLKSSNLPLAPLKGDFDGSPSNWEAIPPMIKTQWNQSAPYNNDAPLMNNQRCYTGCVATSISQIMKYYEYPEVGKGKMSYSCAGIGTLSIDFSQYPFDWDNMLDVYTYGKYTPEQAQAVATLMKATGYAVQMSYSTNVSGALSAGIAGAMIKYFGYDEGMDYLTRSNYSYDEWEDIIYNNLKNVGPMIYDGTAPNSGGHSFICDGYDGNGYFHFNWGWGGSSDGYYTLDVLNPSTIGIGGYAGGFNFQQNALVGMKPSDGQTEVSPYTIQQYGGLTGRFNGANLYLGVTGGYPYGGWGYIGTGSPSLTFAAKIEPLEGDDEEPRYIDSSNFRNLDFLSGYLIPYQNTSMTTPLIPMTNAGLEKGKKYKVTLGAYDTKGSQKWMPVTAYYGFPNYVIVTRDGLEYTVENIPIDNFTISDLGLLSTLYYGCPVNVKATIANKTDLQLSRGACVVLLDSNNQVCFMGDSFLLSLNPGESINKEWLTVLTNQTDKNITEKTEYSMLLYDLDTGLYYDMDPIKVTMEPNPGVPVLMTSLNIEGASKENALFIVNDPSSIPVNVSIRVGKGYFAYPVSVYILEQYNNSQYLTPIINEKFEEVPFLNSGESIELSTEMEFADGTPDKIYFMQSGYANNNATKWMDNQIRFKISTAGVEEIGLENGDIKFFYDKAIAALNVFTTDGVKSVDIYNINGSKLNPEINVSGTSAVVNLSNLGKGMIIVNVTDQNGNTQTAKIML